MIYDHFDAQGLAMGVVVGGFGGGAFIFNQIQVRKLQPNTVCIQLMYFCSDCHLEPQQRFNRWSLLWRCRTARLRFFFVLTKIYLRHHVIKIKTQIKCSSRSPPSPDPGKSLLHFTNGEYSFHFTSVNFEFGLLFFSRLTVFLNFINILLSRLLASWWLSPPWTRNLSQKMKKSTGTRRFSWTRYLRVMTTIASMTMIMMVWKRRRRKR